MGTGRAGEEGSKDPGLEPCIKTGGVGERRLGWNGGRRSRQEQGFTP